VTRETAGNFVLLPIDPRSRISGIQAQVFRIASWRQGDEHLPIPLGSPDIPQDAIRPTSGRSWKAHDRRKR